MIWTDCYKGITIEFDETKHQLFVNGERNPFNVTGITGIVDKSAALIPWAVRLAGDYLKAIEGRHITSEDIDEACRQHRIKKESGGTEGTMVHEFAEQHSLGLNPELPENEKARNGVLAFLRWLEKSEMEIINPEQVIYSKLYGYWGVADAEARKGNKLYLIDYKTSKAIYSTMRYQVAAYRRALIEMKKKKYDGSWILRFDKITAEFEPFFIDKDESEKDFKAFLAAFSLRKRELQLNGR